MPDPVPQPVLKTAAVQAVVAQVVGAVAILTGYFGWWSPSGDDVLVISGAVSTLVGAVLLFASWFVHNRVTPVVDPNAPPVVVVEPSKLDTFYEIS